MPAHISLITLGVADIAKATSFYERFGFVRSKSASADSVSFFQAGPVVLALWGRDAQRDDAQAAELWTGNGGIVVAQNLASEDAVDVAMARAEAAGARILKPAAKTFWGGYNGYFADPDGHVWEVAFNPFWELDEDGRVKLPE
ncbi:MAG TPA: VOC family protein [Methyloceanibacter sp.]